MSFLIHIYFLLPSLVGVYTFSYMTLKAEKCFHIFSNLWQITPFAYYQNINWTGNSCESYNQPGRCQKQLHLTVLWLSFNMTTQGNGHYKIGMMQLHYSSSLGLLFHLLGCCFLDFICVFSNSINKIFIINTEIPNSFQLIMRFSLFSGNTWKSLLYDKMKMWDRPSKVYVLPKALLSNSPQFLHSNRWWSGSSKNRLEIISVIQPLGKKKKERKDKKKLLL